MSKHPVLQSSSSWADEAEDDTTDLSEVVQIPVAPPPANPWKKAEEVKPTGLVFEDFEGPKPEAGGGYGGGGSRDRGGESVDRAGGGGFGDRGGYGERGDRGGYGERGDRGGYGGDRGGYGDRGDRGGYGDRGDRGGYGDRGGEKGGYGDRGDRGGYGERRGGGYGDRGERRPERPGRYDMEGAGGMAEWRSSGYSGEAGGRDRERRDDRGPRGGGGSFKWEVPTQEMLDKIPSDPPFTAFVTLHPSVASTEVTDADIVEHFHDGEGIKVEKARVVYQRDANVVKMIFVDFTDAESLRNALCMEKDFRDAPVRAQVAESREPKRPERAPMGGLSAQERRMREREQGRGDRNAIRPTAFDTDTAEAEWMAKRVQEAARLDEEGGAADGPSPSARVKRDEGQRAAANPFGDAKPRDQKEIEAAFEARKAEERRRKREEDAKRKETAAAAAGEAPRGAKGGRGDKGDGKEAGGDWRAGAKPHDARPRRERGEGGAKEGGPGGERGERKERPPREEPAPAAKAPEKKRPEVPKKEADAPKKPAKPVNLFDLLADADE